MRRYFRQFVPGLSPSPAYRRHESFRLYDTGGTGVSSAGGDGGREPVWGRIANAKIFGWVIYAAGFAVWLFGYLSAGHAPLFDWNAATPWWVSSFVPNFEAELGLALMYTSMIPIYGGAVRKRAFAYTALLVFGAVTLDEGQAQAFYHKRWGPLGKL